MRSQIAMTPEATAKAEFLAACKVCGSPHPKALEIDSDRCPVCNTPAAKPIVRDMDAILVGNYYPRALLAIGRGLAWVARKLGYED